MSYDPPGAQEDGRLRGGAPGPARPPPSSLSPWEAVMRQFLITHQVSSDALCLTPRMQLQTMKMLRCSLNWLLGSRASRPIPSLAVAI